MSLKQLNQLIALEKGVKQRTYKEIDAAYDLLRKPEVLNGFSKEYQPLEENGESLPSESKKVQITAKQLFEVIQDQMTEYLDIETTKDHTNATATGDIVVGGNEIAKDVPVTTLLALEKQLLDLRTSFEKTVTLDPAQDWKFDLATGCHRTEPVKKARTKKVPKVITLSPATDKFPANTQLIQEDIIAGYWVQTEISGALPAPEKRSYIERVNDLLDAVKAAREQANSTPIKKFEFAEKMLNYVFQNGKV